MAKHNRSGRVRFRARVRALRSAGQSSFELPDGGRERCRQVILTDAGLWCLVPTDRDVAGGMMGPLFPGRRLEITGSVLGRMGGRPCLGVERVKALDQAENATEVWKVTVTCGDNDPVAFYRGGNYVLEFEVGEDEPETQKIEMELHERRVVPADEGQDPAEAE